MDQQEKKIKNNTLFLKDSFNKKISLNQEKFPLGLDFFSYFVHELKSPLMSLKFQVDRIKKQGCKEVNQETVDQMEKDISLLFQFIHDSLKMQELEGELKPQLDWISLDGFLLKSKKRFDEWVNHRGLIIDFKNMDKNFEVKIDSRWMSSVFNNLIMNAIQHSPQKGHIEIKAVQMRDQKVKISIKDEGLGIKKGLENKIFNCFQSYRKPSSSLEFKGTGLGLFIAKSVVESHGGQIGVEVENELQGKGCTFYVILPQSRIKKLQKAS